MTAGLLRIHDKYSKFSEMRDKHTRDNPDSVCLYYIHITDTYLSLLDHLYRRHSGNIHVHTYHPIILFLCKMYAEDSAGITTKSDFLPT